MATGHGSMALMTASNAATPGPARSGPSRIAGLTRGAPLVFTWNGEPIQAYDGETIATALLASGRRICRESPRLGSPRGVFCGMGACFECLVVVDGRPGVRACLTPARAALDVRSIPPDHGPW